MVDPMRPDGRPLRLWLVVQRPDDAVAWVEADRIRTAGPHVELLVDVVFLGRQRAVVERRLVAAAVLVCEPVDRIVPWRPHRCQRVREAAQMDIHWAAGGGAIAATVLSSLGVGLALRLQLRQQRMDERQQARLVFAWLAPGTPGGSPEKDWITPWVRNASEAPIYFVRVELSVVTTNAEVRAEAASGATTLGLMLPGEQKDFDPSGHEPTPTGSNRVHHLYVSFTDAVGNRWQLQNARLTLVRRERRRWYERFRPLPPEASPFDRLMTLSPARPRRWWSRHE